MAADRVGNLSIVLSGDASQLNAVMAAAEQRMGAAAAKMNKPVEAANPFRDVAAEAGKMAVGFLAFDKVTDFLSDARKEAVNLAREAERTQIQMKALMNTTSSGAKAAYEDLHKFAGKTPLPFSDISNVHRKLLTHGLAPDEARDVAKQIATMSSITGGDAMTTAQLYGKAFREGHMEKRDYRTLDKTDFPLHEVAKTMDVSGAKFREMVEEGTVPFSALRDTLKRITKTGSKMADGMDDFAETAEIQAKMRKEAHERKMEQYGRVADVPTKDKIMDWAGDKAGQLAVTGQAMSTLFGTLLNPNRPFSDTIDELEKLKNKYHDRNPERDQKENARKTAEDKAQIKDLYKYFWTNTDPESKMSLSTEGNNPFRERLKFKFMSPEELMKHDQSSENAGRGIQIGKTKIVNLLLDAKDSQVEWDASKGLTGLRFRSGALEKLYTEDHPLTGKFHSQMLNDDPRGAARTVMEMRQKLSEQMHNLTPAMGMGSQTAESAINHAIVSSMGGEKFASIEDLLKATKAVEDSVLEELKNIRKELERKKNPLVVTI